MVLYLTFVFWFFLPAPVYAYLDPGTGNALIYVIVSFFGAMLFSLKGVFYKLIGKSSALTEEHADHRKWHKIVIFSEGAIYWGTFRPIVEALLAKNVPFSYYTLDIGDPCLRLSRPYLNNRYIGSGNRAFAKLGNLEADMVISTTPNIGTPGYPVPRSEKIKKLVYVYHALDDMAYHHRNSLDHYDAALTVGDFQPPIIRKLEALRHLPPKEIYPVGLPYMDVLSKRQTPQPGENCTILVASSWGTAGCLRQYGSKFIALLAQANFKIILRAHPYSWKVEPDFLAQIKDELLKYPQIVWDTEVDSTESMQKAALMISDVSGVRVDFLLLQQKPVITLVMPSADMSDFEFSDLKESWLDNELKKLSRTVGKDEIEHLVDIVRETLIHPPTADIKSFRDKNIYNWGHSAEAVAEYLTGQTEGQQVCA